MKKFTIELNVGDKIDLGRFKNVRSEIKDIKLDDHGQPVIITSKGEKKALHSVKKVSPISLTSPRYLACRPIHTRPWVLVNKSSFSMLRESAALVVKES